LEYDLFRLPSAQHKAGLAGLVLQIKAMDPKQAPLIEGIGPLSVTIAFTRRSMIELFDDLYDAAQVETEFDKPWKDSERTIVPPIRTIKRVVEVEGKKKELNKYIYRVTEPRCSLVARRVSNSHPLLRLVRDQIKLVIRTVENARKVYKVRAETGTSGVGESMWDLIAKSKAEKISGSHRLGVEGTTAEGSAFREDARLLVP
jgi:CRISPR-associated protein Cmx8